MTERSSSTPNGKKKSAFEEHKDDLIVQVKKLGETLAPDGDWLFTAFLWSRKKIQIVGFDPQMWNDHESREDLAKRTLPKLIRQYHADTVGIVFTAWTLSLTDADREYYNLEGALPTPSLSRSRVERLCIELVGKFDYVFLHAEVTRREDAPPLLGDFSESSESQSRFKDGIRRGLFDIPKRR